MPIRARCRARPADVAFAAAACIALAGYNNLVGLRPWHRRWYPVVNGCAAAAALAAAAGSGLTAADLGLRRDRLRAGFRLGSAAAAPVVAAFGLAALTPAARPLLNDQRIAGLDRRQLAYQVLLRIPVGTVAWEEIAFRGVLQAALRRVLAEPAATVVGSTVFGLWHIRPTVEALAVNRLAADRGARITRGHRRGGRDRGGGRGVVAAAGTLRQPGRASIAAPGRQLRGTAGQRPDPTYRRLDEVRRPQRRILTADAAQEAGQASWTSTSRSRREHDDLAHARSLFARAGWSGRALVGRVRNGWLALTRSLRRSLARAGLSDADVHLLLLAACPDDDRHAGRVIDPVPARDGQPSAAALAGAVADVDYLAGRTRVTPPDA